MEYATLAVERQGAVAHVWLNRPERRNALSGQLLEDLAAAFTALQRDFDTKAGRAWREGCVLLRGR